MIDRAKLAELKHYFDYGDTPNPRDLRAAFNLLAEEIEKLLAVKEAAESVAFSIAGTVGTKTNSDLPQWLRLRLQDLDTALAQASERSQEEK